MKKFATVVAFAIFNFAPIAASAHETQEKPAGQHSGGTDASGCHYNHKTGDYHCHNPK